MAEELITGFQPIVGQPHPIKRLTLVPSGGGIFEVRRDGEAVFSKKAVGRKPEPGEVLALLRK